MIADYSVHVPDDVWMVRTGHVTLQAADGSAIDTIEPGGIFGYTPLLTGGGMEFVARATEPSTLIRLPGEQVRAQFAKPAGLAFLASSAWSTTAGNRPALVPVADSRPVGELVHGEVLLVAPDVSVRDAVVQMTEHHVSYALISLPDGEYGIFTDRDLRTRVVAAGLSVDVPIARVMSAPARRVTADLTAETVLMQMLESGLRHMPVTSARGEVIGVLEDADLLAASARQSFMLRRSIGLAADAVELQAAAQRVTHTASALFRSGTKASATSGILSIVIDSVVRRALELALAEAPADAGDPDVGVRVAHPRQHRPARGHAVIRRRQCAVVARRLVPGKRTAAGDRPAHSRHPRRLRVAVGQQRCHRRQSEFRAFPERLGNGGQGLARRSARRQGADPVLAAAGRQSGLGRRRTAHRPGGVPQNARRTPERACGCNCSTRSPDECVPDPCATCSPGAAARST